MEGFLFQPPKEVKNVLKTELEVIAVGKPDITALTESERRLFFETLYARVLELAKEKKENWLYCILSIGRVATQSDNSNQMNYVYG